MSLTTHPRRRDRFAGKLTKRNSRYRKIGDFWFFSTREGILMGPYSSRQRAEEETEKYIDFACHARNHILKVMKKGVPTPGLSAVG